MMSAHRLIMSNSPLPELQAGKAPSSPSAFGARSVRSGVPVSVSERAGNVPTAVPDSADGSLAGRFGVNHSSRFDTPTTPDDARFLSSLERRVAPFVMTTRRGRFQPRVNTDGTVASVFLPASTAQVVQMPQTVNVNRAALSPLSTPSLRSVAGEGGLAPQFSYTRPDILLSLCINFKRKFVHAFVVRVWKQILFPFPSIGISIVTNVRMRCNVIIAL